MRTLIRLPLLVVVALNVATCHPEGPHYNRSNTALIFDVDDTLLNRTASVPTLMWKHKGALLKGLFDFKLITEVVQLYRKTAPVGAYMTLLERNGSYAYLLPFARDLALTRVFNEKMACIISELLALGYDLHIGTNETWNEFSIHIEHYPLFHRFVTYTLADYSHYPDTLQKPDSRYFAHLRARVLAYNPRKKYLFFIDDRNDNVTAARMTGFIGIQFKSPEQLERELVSLNIMPPTCTMSPLATSVAL